jgi:phage shock protein C
MIANQKRALRRSRSNRMLAGVCGGLADFFGISSFWFRLGMLIAFIPGGVEFLLHHFDVRAFEEVHGVFVGAIGGAVDDL